MSDETQQSPAGEAISTPKRPRRSPASKKTATESSSPATQEGSTPDKAAQAKTPRPRVQKTKAAPETAPADTATKRAASANRAKTAETDSSAAPKPRGRRPAAAQKPTSADAPAADITTDISAPSATPKMEKDTTAPTTGRRPSRGVKSAASTSVEKTAPRATRSTTDAVAQPDTSPSTEASTKTATPRREGASNTRAKTGPRTTASTRAGQAAPTAERQSSERQSPERQSPEHSRRAPSSPELSRTERQSPQATHKQEQDSPAVDAIAQKPVQRSAESSDTRPAGRTSHQSSRSFAHPDQAQEGAATENRTDESQMAEASDPSTPEGDATARKSRRGRRGGRGRSRGRSRDAVAPSADAANADDSGDAGDTTEQSADITSTQQEDAPSQGRSRQSARTSTSADRTDSPATGRTGGRTAAKSQGRPSTRDAGRDSARDTGKDTDTDAETSQGAEKVGRRKMFISVVPGEQVEVALVEEGAIHEYYLEMLHQAKTKGNIYKGVIHNIDTNLQAAFVNYGTNKNGFLQIDEVHPEYYLTHHEAMKGKKFPPMQKVLKAGQEVLVQVVKEPSGSKGAFLTTWLSLAGRFLVLTPGQEQIGVSRKVENDEERARLREMMNGIDPGEGLGVIVRTVSAGTSKTTLKNDLQYLKRVWKDIRKRGTSEPTPSLIYQEPGLAERAVRDYLTDDVCEVWVDDAPEAEALRETVSLLFPRKGDLVKVHTDLRQTLWERFNIQRQLEQIYSREVTLPSGGRLVFDQTEALMAIDINSGKISGKGNFEAMALRTNVEAAECIARQLKLRDIGGQIVIDFIEMRDKNHIRDVEKTLRSAMKNDRARHDVGRMSSFGLLEIVRQRTASSALAITMEPCPVCGGTGLRRNIEWQALQIMREIARLARVCTTGPCQIELATELGMYLLNHKRDRLREMEKQHNVPIEIKIRP